MAYTGDKKREYQREWIKRRREIWITENGPCKECGSWQDLEIHHKKARSEEAKGKAGNALFSLPARLRDEELAKCIVLCRTCHAFATAQQLGYNVCGTETKYKHGGCRCIECTTAHTLSRREYRARTGKR